MGLCVSVCVHMYVGACRGQRRGFPGVRGDFELCDMDTQILWEGPVCS